VCEAEIEDSLELENVTAILFLADRANAPRLKRACIEFMHSVWIDFQPSKAWQELQENSPGLAEEVQAAIRAELVEEEDALEESDDEEEGEDKKDKGKEKEKEKEVVAEEPPTIPMLLPPALVADD